jgi:hypothetical protein
MTDPDPPKKFVEALLAQETRVSEEQYAAHRQRLDRRLTAAARPWRWRRLPPLRLLAAAAVLLGIGLGLVLALHGRFKRLPSGNEDQKEELVLLRPDQDAPARPVSPTPYELTAKASLVALATTKPGVVERGREVVPLRIDRVLKDETKQETPAFGCAYSAPEPVSELLPADTRLIVYLMHNREKGWSLLGLQPIDAMFEQRQLPGIERCVEVLNVSRKEDAPRLYSKLLGPEAGGLDEPACSALMCCPDPKSADVLLGQLRAVHQRIGGQEGRDLESAAVQLSRLAGVLAKMHEARAAVLVAECTRHLPRGRRAEFYARLPALCQSASAAVLARVRRVLSDEIEDRASNPDDVRAAVSALPQLAR